MLYQQVVLDDEPNQSESTNTSSCGRQSVPPSKVSRSDVAFPLISPSRRRGPSISSIQKLNATAYEQNGQSMGVLTIRAVSSPDVHVPDQKTMEVDTPSAETTASRRNLEDLPLEVQGKVLDYIFGDMHSVHAGSTSLRGKSVSSLMRHPRRKAVSDFALVSNTWRDLVQERIYRHIKIKGTRSGLRDSADFFSDHDHLTRFVRHIEFWVPVWGDRSSLEDRALALNANAFLAGGLFRHDGSAAHDQLVRLAHGGHGENLSFSFKLCAYSATLSEIFVHINCFFPHARVFTLEGGHCKKSNMIRQFPKTLFPEPNPHLEKLPNIRTFAMRGAWNVMRNYNHWKVIEDALPNVQEWHCGYAKPRLEADYTINEILLRLPSRLRHVNISLDGMYSKDPSTLGSSSSLQHTNHHLCENLGNILPQLESCSFTGKICECIFSSAIKTVKRNPHDEPRLQHLELVVKSCCRQRVTELDPLTSEPITHELGGVMADGTGITNLIFIKAFTRLVLNTVKALPYLSLLKFVRVRYIDLDSPCTLLNPYWLLHNGQIYGIWDEEIVEILSEVRPDLQYEELGDGIDYDAERRKRMSTGEGETEGIGAAPDGFGGVALERNGASGSGGGGCSLYPKWKPKSIKTSSYKVIAEARS
jgi:hypothetical protein